MCASRSAGMEDQEREGGASQTLCRALWVILGGRGGKRAGGYLGKDRMAIVSGKWGTGRDWRTRSIFVQWLCTGKAITPLYFPHRRLGSRNQHFFSVSETRSFTHINSFSMAAIDMNSVQFCPPPPSILHKQRNASSYEAMSVQQLSKPASAAAQRSGSNIQT